MRSNTPTQCKPVKSYHYPRAYHQPWHRNALAARGWPRCLGCGLWIDPARPEPHTNCVCLTLPGPASGGPDRAA